MRWFGQYICLEMILKSRQQLLDVISFASLPHAQGAWPQAAPGVTKTVEQNEDGISTVQRQGDVATCNAEEPSRSPTSGLGPNDDDR